MDYEILVKEFRKVIKIIRQKHEHIALAMIKAFDIDIRLWNFIISISEYDDLYVGDALRDFITIVDNNIDKKVKKEIMRFTVLKTDDPFVKEINRIFKVKKSVKYIKSLYFAGIYIEEKSIYAPVVT
jgi:hypothetical protein